MNIYELTGAIKELHDMLDEDKVEELAELEAKLLDELIPEKVDGYRRLVMTLHGEVHTIDTEIARLKARSESRSKLIERLKTRLKTALESSGLKSFKTPLGTVSVQASAPAVVIEHEDLVPLQFFDVPSPRVSKSAIGQALRAGQDVPGARLVRGTHLRIK